MSSIFILCAMIFLHIIDDYVLQAPCLCDLKQKSFWEKNAPEEQYKKDYIVALIMHAISWSFMIMLPIAPNVRLGSNIVTRSVLSALAAPLRVSATMRSPSARFFPI